jgi:putative ABC transport system ATP-binding protein
MKDLHKKYGDGSKSISILKGINFAVAEGDFIAIMGVSGSGKTTLLNILGCLDTPTTGSYLFCGQNISKFSARKLAKFRNEQIGFVFQNYCLLPKETVYRNVELPLLYSNLSSRERKSRVLTALRQVGMEDRAGAYANDLSGGQKQKIAIARAIVRTPALLLADEPTGNLDAESTRSILDIFSQLNRAGTTIIMVTHDPNVAKHAMRTVIMDKDSGRIC